MDTFLKLSQDDQRLYCEQAQAKLGLPAASIEKDFWVCWTLRELFNLPKWGEHLSFKGGTSLSKAWKMIERFSEDIDVVIDREFLGFGGTLSKNRKDKIRKVCSERIHQELFPALDARFREILPPEVQWSLRPATVEEDCDQQTLFFEYPGLLKGTAKYVRPVVVIEMGARSDTEPSEIAAITPYLCDAFPEQLGEGTFSIKTIAARRTFWEKAMLLHEETYRPPSDKPRKRALARHYYDLWCLIRRGEAEKAISDSGLFERVAAHRLQFFKQNWLDYETLRPGSLRLLPNPEQLASWHSDYREMGNEMFFGDVPDFDEVLRVVGEFEKRLNESPTRA